MMRRSMMLLALTGAVAAACDYPTEPPRWHDTFRVPATRVDIGVAQLLPPDVRLNEDSTALITDAPEIPVSANLGTMCPACQLAHGTVAPKPAFEHTMSTTTTLPSDVVSASLAGGAFPVTLSHDLNFDPLRPAGAGGELGQIRVTIQSDGAVVADTTISGATQTFEGGETLSPTLNVRPVDIASELVLQVHIASPAGDPVEIDAADTLGVRVAGTPLELAEASLSTGAIDIEPTRTTMDFSGIAEDSPILDRIESGGMIFQVANPFAVTGSLSLHFQLPDRTIDRALAVEQGEYGATMPLSGEELRDMLGSDQVELVAGGTVRPSGGMITVAPGQELLVESDFELVLLVGGQEEE